MFTTLILGFCATFSTIYGNPFAEIGYISQGECIVHMALGDTNGQSVTFGGHSFSAKMLDGDNAVEITIDEDRKFVVLGGVRA